MKRLMLLVLMFVAMIPMAFADDAPTTDTLRIDLSGPKEIPSHVTYKPAPAEQSTAAAELLRKLFASSDPQTPRDSIGDILIVGPGLHMSLKDSSSFQALSTNPVKVVMPITGGESKGTQTVDAAMIRTENDRAIAWRALRGYLPSRIESIRKPSAEELRIYWAMIPYDIEEPVLTIEGQGKRIFVDIDEDGKIMWIDDYTEVSFEP